MTTQALSQVAAIILEQLGGIRRLALMISVNNIASDNNSVTFHFKGSKKVNKVKITLTHLDLYDLIFYQKIRGSVEVKEVKTYEEIYADQLISIFEEFTSLYLHF